MDTGTMPLSYTMTDDEVTPPTSNCSGVADHPTPARVLCTQGGTPGTSVERGTMQVGERVFATCEIAPGPGRLWRAGDWTARISLSADGWTSNYKNIVHVHVCRLNAARESQETLGSKALDTQSFLGEFEFDVSCSAPSDVSTISTDLALVTWVGELYAGYQSGDEFFGFVHDQAITAPIIATAALVGRGGSFRGTSRECH